MAVPNKRPPRPGSQNGAPVRNGGSSGKPTRLRVMDYNAGTLTEAEAKTAADLLSFKDKKTVTWINVDGLGDAQLLESIGEGFGLHPLVVEDILTPDQRPKMEAYDDYLYIVLRMLDFEEKDGKTKSEQVSLVLGKDFLLSFQETGEDIFDPVRERIRGAKGRTRKLGPDYLAYSLIDAVVDRYFIILEKMGERIERMESELITNPTPKTLRHLYKLKREMIRLRKSVWPLREVVSALERPEYGPLISKNTRIYLRDVYDHTIQTIDTVETFRDMLSGMVDIYLSSISYKLNEVMKLLTVIGTIFLPLTFITGVYGMNFQFMPELGDPYGYFGALVLMLTVALVMLAYFRVKRWL